jgi:hypothetical protein
MPTRRRQFALRTVLVLGATALVAIAATTGATARPTSVQIVLNPDADTFLAQGTGRAQDGAADISTGWIYTVRTREFRAYLHFPLDPARHPPAGLLQAELWLYPRNIATSQMSANFRVQSMTEALVPGRVAPDWFSAGEPSVELALDAVRMDWKVIRVRDMVLEMLRNPSVNHGFAISGSGAQDNTRFDFMSREGADPYPTGNQPRLVLAFSDDAFPTPTRQATDTPVPSSTRPPTETPAGTATATPTLVPSSTATTSATSTLTPPPAIVLPRLLRGK